MELVLVRHALPERIDATVDGAAADPGLVERADASYVPVEELKAAGDPRWELLRRGDPGGRAVLFTRSRASRQRATAGADSSA
jgi:hypothetical protein